MPRVPKTIAGVRVPKELRGQAEALLRFASHPLVSDTIAAALIAGSAALAERKGGAEVGKAAGVGAGAAAIKAASGANRIAVALAVAAAQLLVSRIAEGQWEQPKAKKRKQKF